MNISLKAEPLFHILGMTVTNSVMLSLVTLGALALAGILLSLSLKEIPGKVQGVWEVIVEGLLDFMESILGTRAQAERFFPFIASLFLFILLNNWVGLLPGIGSIGMVETHGGKEVLVPFLRSANSDLNTTLALALISVLMVQFYGFRQAGFFGHIGKYFPLRKGPVEVFVGVLELMEEFAKVFSFSFRLFGNVFAGEVLLLITMNLMPVFLPLPFMMLEIFVGFIQAFVFTILTLIFLKVTVETAHH
ncbi:MAG: F0F1 ATP synthase subunit A [Candidatus Wildermuthbacteria bacterium]|nr:F0F1 ATP synthase subunit A [Candidatus Wildermuthbacteria bacterium]